MANLSDIGVIKDVLARHGFTFSKAMGQNFLINPSVCPKMAQEAAGGEKIGILEIGAGIGVLTSELAKVAEKVVCVELDKRLLPILDETLAEFDNIEIVNDDIMKIDLDALLAEKFAGMKIAVCANLPYYITSPVIMRLLESRLPVERMIFMVQKEAAQRLCARVGSRDSGAVTVAVDYYSDAKKLFDVSRGSFMPPPNVDSAVIRLDVRNEYPLGGEEEKFFFSVVKAAFAQRRKTFVNSVSSGLGIGKNAVARVLEANSLDERVRAESLSMQQLIAVSLELKKQL